MASSLPPIQEDAALGSLSTLAPTHQGNNAVARRQLPPWQSPAIQELTSLAGRGDPSASPMVIEGRTGTVMAAVGAERDHAIASRALSQSMQQPKSLAGATALGGRHPRQPPHQAGGGGAVAAASGGRLAVGQNKQRHGAAFGAVYEYRDSAVRRSRTPLPCHTSTRHIASVSLSIHTALSDACLPLCACVRRASRSTSAARRTSRRSPLHPTSKATAACEASLIPRAWVGGPRAAP